MRGFYYKYVFILWVLLPSFVSGQGKIIAHRGASSIAPENTVASYMKAIEAGADFIEIDLRLSKDDSIMVIHDETLDRTTNGTGEVKNYDYNYLKSLSAGYPKKFGQDFTGEQIPTLFEVLKLVKGKVDICIDIKNTPEMPVLIMIEKMTMTDNVVLMSYNVDKLKRIKTKAPQIRTVLIKNILSNVDLEVAKDIEAYGVSGGYVSPVSIIKNAHEKGLQCWLGIVDDPAKTEQLFEKNLDAVFTNYPQLMAMSREDDVTAYPNPFSNYISIPLKHPENIKSIQIVDNTGATIYKSEGPFSTLFKWRPGKNVKNGLFLIYITGQENVFRKKILFL